jgi:hypothetical protein
MPHRIPQSVAIRVPLKAYLSSDHLSDATSKTIAVVISKNGAGFGNPAAGVTNATEVGGAGNGNGWYYVDLGTGDTDTLGPLIIRGTVATIDNTEIVYQVVKATNAGYSGVPDAVAGAANGLTICGSNAAATFASLTITGALTNGSTVLGNTTVGTLGVGAITGTTVALSGAVTAASVTLSGTFQAATIVSTGTTTLNALTITNNAGIGGTLTVTGTTTLTGAVTATAGITANITGNLIGTVSTLTTYTGNTPQTGDSYAIVNGASGLVAIKSAIGTPVALSGGTATISGMIVNLADNSGGAAFSSVTDSLHTLTTKVAQGIGSVVLAESDTETVGTLISGTFASTFLDDNVFWITAPTAGGLDVHLQYDLGDATPDSVFIWGNFAAGGTRFVDVYAYNWVTASYDLITDAVNRFTNSATEKNIDITLLPAHKDSVTKKTLIRFLSTSTNTGDRLKIDQCIVHAANAGPTAAQVASQVWLNATRTLDASGVAAIQSGLSTLTEAQVNAEVVDALAVDTYAEPGQETPASTNTIEKKLSYVFKGFRNKLTQSTTEAHLYNDGGSVVDQKATVSDDGTTFTRGELATGP